MTDRVGRILPKPPPQLKAPAGYRAQAIDISIEADLLDFYLLRQRSVTERIAIAAHLMDGAKELSLYSLSRQFVGLSPEQFARKLAEAWLQEDCPPDYVPQGSEMTWIQNSVELAAQLHTILTAAEISYYVTGGVAAIAYGDPRTTRDLDAVIRIPISAVAQLQRTLEQAGFYVAGADDVAAGRMKTLQITQMATISRADLILADESPYGEQQFARRRRFPFPNGAEVYLAAPEDIVVSKLRWGLRSESEKQQRDVLAILKVQQDALDYQYMYCWVAEFELSHLLEQLVTAGGVRAIAAQQWANAIYPVAIRAFLAAQSADRVVTTSTGEVTAEGHLYALSQHIETQILTIAAQSDRRLIARFDGQSQVISAHPSLLDRQQWQDITARLR